MQKVEGIGGVFFRARDPEALAKWYADHLGVDLSQGAWMASGGPTVLAPFASDTDYFGDRAQAWMLNFRVADLDAMLAQLAAAGIDAITKAEWDSGIGRFARIHDPEGNPIELWQPAGPAAGKP
jgi:predicted enzyme related to lactoylglutathione lyase